jgi:[ribosomal protein S18]-alanine N-acetyltransferase
MRNIRLKYDIRAFEPADAAAVAQLAAASPQAAQWSEQSYAKLLDSGYAGWVAVGADTALGGFIITRLIATEAEILNLAVAAQHRRAGVASALLESALGSFALANVRRVYLEVRASNAPAITFYQKLLFTITGKRPSYYQYPTESAVLMEMILTAPKS